MWNHHIPRSTATTPLLDNPSYNGKYYYNNFEVVDMRPFRGRAHWDFFMTVEKDGSFMCPKGVAPGGKCKDGANGIGDADFGVS